MRACGSEKHGTRRETTTAAGAAPLDRAQPPRSPIGLMMRALRLRRSTNPRGGTPPPGSLPARPAGSGSGLRRLVRVALPRAAEPATSPVAPHPTTRSTPEHAETARKRPKPAAPARGGAVGGAARPAGVGFLDESYGYAPVSGAPGGAGGARPLKRSVCNLVIMR